MLIALQLWFLFTENNESQPNYTEGFKDHKSSGFRGGSKNVGLQPERWELKSLLSPRAQGLSLANQHYKGGENKNVCYAALGLLRKDKVF